MSQKEATKEDEYGWSIKHKSKLILVMVAFCMLVKTFFFLRIFKELSYLVIMIK